MLGSGENQDLLSCPTVQPYNFTPWFKSLKNSLEDRTVIVLALLVSLGLVSLKLVFYNSKANLEARLCTSQVVKTVTSLFPHCVAAVKLSREPQGVLKLSGCSLPPQGRPWVPPHHPKPSMGVT